jgi:KDO2-lipid IV(A) lauroyltransferase
MARSHLSALGFYFFLPLLYLISILPFRVLYIISDMLFPVIYYLVGYRKKVVLDNLRNSFPEKTEQEIHSISKKFYRHFTDVILEILKMQTVSPRVLRNRINYSNPELLRKYFNENKGLIGLSAHFNNWEWASACSDWGPHHTVIIYKPLNNRYFDRFMKKGRERHGVEMISMRDTLRQVVKDQKEGNLVLYGLVYDQSPVWEETQHWTTFLGQYTAVMTGAEKLAMKTGLPAVYFSMRKIKRGRYIIDLIPISEDHTGKKENEITEDFYRCMEEKIRANPEFWLWTHRRWKLTPRKLAEMENS